MDRTVDPAQDYRLRDMAAPPPVTLFMKVSSSQGSGIECLTSGYHVGPTVG
ncbi:hypothetical protein ACUN9V_08405 [Salinicola sp. V024]|uniref:hypothetical protein n=1 Tax=Salinicola sp. V024 TaxID=3459609 RepID=UPI004043EC95